MKVFLTVVHVIVSIAVMAVILMQQRKQGGFTGVFGGGTQADAAGGQWQRFTVLTKATIVLMVIFLVSSVVLVLMS